MSLCAMLFRPALDIAVYGHRLIAAHALLASGDRPLLTEQLCAALAASSSVIEVATDFVETVLMAAPDAANDARWPGPEAA